MDLPNATSVFRVLPLDAPANEIRLAEAMIIAVLVHSNFLVCLRSICGLAPTGSTAQPDYQTVETLILPTPADCLLKNIEEMAPATSSMCGEPHLTRMHRNVKGPRQQPELIKRERRTRYARCLKKLV